MNDILSQAEIDKLLSTLISGEGATETEQPADAQPETVRRYDFKSANRFTKEQIRALGVIFKNFGQLLSNFLMGLLRADCEADVVSIEEMSFNEFNNSVPSPSIIAVVNSNPFPGSLAIVVSKEMSYAIINRVLGGTKGVATEGRQFTEIDLAIIERVLGQILKIMDESWAKMMEVKSFLEKIETSMQFAQIVDINEAVLTVSLNITIGKESAVMGFCLPHQALEPFMKSLNAGMVYTGKTPVRQGRPQDIINSLINTEITVSCVFNTTEAVVRDIMSLREGDVIRLTHKVGEPLTIKYQQVPKFRAGLGVHNGRMAVKVSDIIRGDEEIE